MKTPWVWTLYICVSVCTCVCNWTYIMVQSVLESWKAQKLFNHAVCVNVLYTCVWGCANLKCTPMCDPPQNFTNKTQCIFLPDKHATISFFTQEWTALIQKTGRVCVTEYPLPIPPYTCTHTYTKGVKQGLDVTWCCSCCPPLIPACISPAAWQQSDAQPRVLWSGVQTEVPVEFEKEKVFVTQTHRGRKRKNLQKPIYLTDVKMSVFHFGSQISKLSFLFFPFDWSLGGKQMGY